MSAWRELRRGVRALVDRSGADRDVADEAQHYLDQAVAGHRARGLSADDALRTARLELGGMTTVQEQMRGYGWENFVDTALADLRYATRRLRSAPGFTAITVLTLALGIGGTTAIFSAVSPILLEPLPYPEADRIAMIWEIGNDGSRVDGTFGMYRHLAERTRDFDAIAAYKPWQPTMAEAAQPERFDGQSVTAGFFRVLGILPALGRGFQSADDQPGGPKVVVISDRLWRRRFGGDSAIIRQRISLDDRGYAVIGVMPRSFENVLAPSADVWTLLQYGMERGYSWGHHLRTVGRLRPPVGIDQASRELQAIGNAVVEEQRPETYGPTVTLRATALQEDVTRGVKRALLVILGGVILVLAIACVNVTNLLLARAVQRRGEFALRAALGAARGRLIRQLLTENLLLALLGGLAGMVVAIVGVRALIALSPPEMPRVDAISLDAGVFAFGMAVTMLIGLAFGLVPAIHAARSDPHQALDHASRRTTGGHMRARGALVVAEVALAFVLLVSSGLLLRSLQRVFAVPAGFDSNRLLTLQILAAGSQYTQDSNTNRFYDRALAAIRQVPGVTAAGLTSQLPLSGDLDEYGVMFDGSTVGFNTLRYAVSPGYIETMRIPLRRGRSLEERDGPDAPLAALINESFAARRFPGVDPIGHRLQIGPVAGYTIVGVVGDVKQVSLAVGESDAVYTTASQWRFRDRVMSIVVRTRENPVAIAPAIRQAVWSVDRNQPVVRVATMDDLLAASASQRRFALVLFEAFALTALILAAAGIYGVLSGRVAERSREIGVRSALGASRGSILGLVLRQGMTLVAIGVAIGLAGALAATQSLSAMLFGISRLDPITYVGVIALLVVVSAIACWIPASRASRLDPLLTLRAD